MTKHTGAGFFPGARRNLSRHDVADSTQAEFALFRFAFNLLSIFRTRALCNDDQRTQIPGGVTRANGVGYSVEIEWNFRDQDDISATGDTTVQGDPTGMAPSLPRPWRVCDWWLWYADDQARPSPPRPRNRNRRSWPWLQDRCRSSSERPRN